MSHNILCDPKLTFKSIPITHAFDLQDIKCTSRTRCRQAATRRVRHNSRGPCYQIPAEFHRKGRCCRRSQQPSDDMATEATARLHVFEPASPSDVKRIVMTSAAKSCELDPLPTSLLKTHIDFMCPVLARNINASLSSSVVPPPMKHAVVIPILKKRCYDVNIHTNYRPISNIVFVAKLTERFVAQQLQHFMDVNGIYGVYQSAYRPQHSVESALLRIHNDVAQSIDSRRSVLLVLLDLTAAFDTIDHNILMRRLHGYGLCGDVHAWLTSYLRNRTNVVRVKSSVSQLNTITTGVPQGSVLGLILFNAYVAPLAKLLQQRNMQHHLYAYDTQLYVTFPPSEHTRAFERMEECVREVKIWLCDNGLVLNENKSEAIIMQSPNVRTPITMSRINICGQLVDTSAVIRDLGFVMDDHLSMASQVSNICRSAYYHLSRIAKIRHSLTTSVCKSLIHGLVTSQIRRGDRQSMTTILQRSVKKCIEFKILVLVHKAIYEGQPVNLVSLLNQHTPKRCLRSSSGLLLDVPRVNLERFGRRAFACAGPTLWNNLPISLRVNGNHTQFKKLLKTYLFST